MIPNVVSFFPLKRFTDAGVELPGGLNICFREASNESDIIEVCRGADFLLLPASYPVITRKILENIPSVRLIQSVGAGYDKVDVESAAELGIPVANSPGENALTVAEFTISLLVILQRRITFADREVKAGNYRAVREIFFRQGLGEIRGTQLGLIGLGAIGREVARAARFFGARLSYFDIRRHEDGIEEQLGIEYLPLEDLLLSSDVLSLHVPLTGQTKQMIGARELGRMKKGSYLINTSRGELVDPVALAKSLESGHLAGAAIDTVSPEPPAAGHPLLNLTPAARERLLITPHIAGISRGAIGRMLQAALVNITRVAAGGIPRHVVNGVLEPRER